VTHCIHVLFDFKINNFEFEFEQSVEAQRIILCQLLDISTAGKAADTTYNEPQLLKSTNSLNQQQQKQLKELFSDNSYTNQNFSK